MSRAILDLELTHFQIVDDLMHDLVEIVQAQETVASASDVYIEALYSHNLAKAGLAQARCPSSML